MSKPTFLVREGKNEDEMNEAAIHTVDLSPRVRQQQTVTPKRAQAGAVASNVVTAAETLYWCCSSAALLAPSAKPMATS
jgi:hypothetical protein